MFPDGGTQVYLSSPLLKPVLSRFTALPVIFAGDA
jgi:hypothetical protein